MIEGESWCIYLINHAEKVHHTTIHLNDEIYYFTINAKYLGSEDQEILITLNDITELRKKDELLYEQSKLASMGEMIGNIAHQWRQPLSIISTGATGLKMQKEYGILNDDNFYETCELIDNNAQFLSKTIDDFKNFIKGERKKTDFYLKDNIDHLLQLVEPTIKRHNLKVIKEIDDNIIINGYPNELIQCLMNLFNNSKDALLTNSEDSRYIFISSYKKNGETNIIIKDSADGIPSDIIDKIFEPYFTTKHQSQGTGLGLHMTYRLIKDGMNGTIKAENTEFIYNDKKCKGAQFTITFKS